MDKDRPKRWEVEVGGGINDRVGGVDLCTFCLCSYEEPNEIPAVYAGGPPFISHCVGGSGETEHPQAILAVDEVLSVPIPSCLGLFVVNRWRCSSQRRFLGQV